MNLQKYLDSGDQRFQYDYDEMYFEEGYVQSVIDASKYINSGYYELSNVNVVKLLHDHGANFDDWKEDSRRVNDPVELLSWLGY